MHAHLLCLDDLSMPVYQCLSVHTLEETLSQKSALQIVHSTIAIDQRKCDSRLRRCESHLRGGPPKFKIASISSSSYSSDSWPLLVCLSPSGSLKSSSPLPTWSSKRRRRLVDMTNALQHTKQHSIGLQLLESIRSNS